MAPFSTSTSSWKANGFRPSPLWPPGAKASACGGPSPTARGNPTSSGHNPLDAAPLDALFEAWSLHPEARPAGHAVEFFLDETPDETWAACLAEVLAHLGA